jgi:hypothetical protein
MRAGISGLILAAALVIMPAAADQGFKDWWAVCDNGRECVAIGFSPENAEDYGYLRLARGAEPSAAATIEIVAALDAPAWTVLVDGQPVPGVPRLARREDRVVLDAAQSAALLRALVNGSVLEVRGGAGAQEISLAGSSAALRWIDDQQKRAGAVTALVAKGAKPASAVPPPPPLPLVVAAPAVSQSGLPTKLPKSVVGLLGDCDPEIGERFEQEEPIIARLSPGVVLYGVLCSAGAYNLMHTFFLADERGRGARPLDIRYANGQAAGPEVMNVDFDPASQTLSNFEKGRGIADCGAVNTWVWTGKAFEPTEQSLMGECRGVGAGDWPVVFRSRQR